MDVFDTLLKLDCKLTVLSFPSICDASLNLNVPIPTEVKPNPTVFDLMVAVLIPVFSKSIDNIPELKLDVNVPIKFDEKLAISPLST